MGAWSDFSGAKLMLFAGTRLVVLRRDVKPGLVWPGGLDFPGGGREGVESPEDCALRETFEELGLQVPREALEIAHLRRVPNQTSWFFAAHLPDTVLDEVEMGDEGQGWQAMAPEDFLAHPAAIPHFAAILREYLKRQAY